VRFDDRVAGATVVEVRAADRAGMLYRMVRALDRAGLDVLTALLSTIGPDVVNSFYVRGRDDGQPLPHGEARDRLRRIVLAHVDPSDPRDRDDPHGPSAPVTGR
jgi:[protein-PII] uridylyltransferase